MKFILKRRVLKKILLGFLLLASVFVYVISKEQSLLNEFKIYLESEVAQALSREVSIEYISGGIATPITLNNLEISYNKDRTEEPLLRIKEIKINKRIWNLPFIKTHMSTPLNMKVKGATLYVLGKLGPKIKEQKGEIILDRASETLAIDLSNEYYNFVGIAKNIYHEPKLDLKLKVDSALSSATVNVSGKYDFPNVEADLNIFGLLTASFSNFIKIEDGKVLFDNLIIQDQYLAQGEIDTKKREALFKVKSEDKEKICFTLTSIDNNLSEGLLEINHLKFRETDIDGSFAADVALKRNKSGIIDGIKTDLRTNTLIIDYQPAVDIYGVFFIKDDKLIIDHLKMGENLKISGWVNLSEPKDMDMNIDLINLDPAVLKNYAFAPANLGFDAISNCSIEIKGELPNPYVKIHFVADKGSTDEIEFESIKVTLDGEYPLLYFRDSRINRKVGHLVVTGKMDFRKLKSGGLFDDMIIKSDRETIVWEGWDITKKKMDDEITLRRSVNDDISVFYKSYLKDETKAEEKSRDTIELEYEIFDNRSLKMKLNEEEEFFGLENKIKF
jgi:hypothetical protein